MAETSQPLRPEPGRENGPRPSSNASVPPSEPRSSRGSFAGLDAHVDRPARFQMIIAGLLLLVLVVVPLYLWRRPRAEAITVSTGGADAGVLPAVTAPPATSVVEDRLVLGEAKILSCHDPGAKKTLPEQCDHVVDLERAFAKAIDDSAACVPHEAGGGSVIYVADVLFAKKKTVAVTTPKEGRTLKNGKLATACEKVVRTKLAAAPLDAMKHEHMRYRIAITATYPGATKTP